MLFVVCTKKFQLSKLVCCAIYLNILVLNIFNILHMIPYVWPLLLLVIFKCFPWSKISSLYDVIYNCFWISCENLHHQYMLMCAYPFVYQIFDLRVGALFPLSVGWLFFCGINIIYNFSVMAWCTDPTVDDYIKGLE